MRILKILLLTICFSLTTGCMQHNGHIGDWFGTWKLTSIELDGAENDAYQGNIFFQFQSDVVRIVEVDTRTSNKFKDCFGTWNQDKSTLELNFGYTAEESYPFVPPTIVEFTRGENVLHIAESSSKSMVWTYQKPDSETTITYRLKKQ